MNIDNKYIFDEDEHLYSTDCGSTSGTTSKIYFSRACKFIFHVQNGLYPIRNWFKEFNEMIKNSSGHIELHYKAEKKSSIKHLLRLTGIPTTIKKKNNDIKLTAEQEEIYSYCKHEYLLNDAQKRCKLIGLIGAAGTGKSTSLNQFFGQTEHIGDEPKQNFIYVTLQNSLVATFMENTEMKRNKQAFTYAGFLMKLLNLNYWKYRKFNLFLTQKTVTNYQQLFNKLSINYNSFRQFWCSNTNQLIDINILTICIDEFSLTECNVFIFTIKLFLHLLHHIIPPTPKFKMHLYVILSGDFHQIQPILISKNTQNDLEQMENEHMLSVMPQSYTYNKLSSNCQKIFQIMNKTFFLKTQLRNEDQKYSDELINNLISDNWKQMFKSQFSDYICVRYIHFDYKLHNLILEELYLKFIHSLRNFSINNKQIEKPHGLAKKFDKLFDTFNYICWCNEDAHFINLSVFYACHTLTKTYAVEIIEKNIFGEIDKQTLYKKLFPKISRIYVIINKERYFIDDENQNKLPFLPLIVGLKYKFLNNSPHGELYRGQELYLAYIHDQGYLIFIDIDDNVYLCQPSIYRMNLYNLDKLKEYILDFPNLKIEDFSISGFPVQLSCGTTSRTSIGLTLKNDIYINAAGLSKEELYVSLSRCKRKDQIKGIFMP